MQLCFWRKLPLIDIMDRNSHYTSHRWYTEPRTIHQTGLLEMRPLKLPSHMIWNMKIICNSGSLNGNDSAKRSVYSKIFISKKTCSGLWATGRPLEIAGLNQRNILFKPITKGLITTGCYFVGRVYHTEKLNHGRQGTGINRWLHC